VFWVTQGAAEAALNFADWRNRHFPGNTNSALGSLDSDADGNSNLMEYLAGTDPTRFFRLRPALVQSLISGEHIPFR
jgi:hypothetical protein